MRSLTEEFENLAESSRKFAVQTSEVAAVSKIFKGNVGLFCSADEVVSLCRASGGAAESISHLLCPLQDLRDLGQVGSTMTSDSLIGVVWVGVPPAVYCDRF